jgi:PAS domain S-box-containing protein
MVRERREVVRAGDPDATAATGEPVALGLPVGWGAPLEIDRRLWGALVVAGETGLPLQSEAAHRLEHFAHLSALAVAHVEAREALHRQVVETQQFASLVERSDDFIAIADTELQVVYVNPAGLRLVGLESLDEACNYIVQDFLTPESAAISIEEGRPALAEKGSWQGELNLRNFKTGEEIPVSSNSLVIAHPRTGKRLFLATVQRDLRERKAAEMQLRRRAEEVEQLAAARRFLLVEALSAEERMRRQIGDALHDNVLQELYAARQDLDEVERDKEALYRARVGVDAAVRQLREAVSDLHPAVTATRDLEARLHSILEEGRTRAGFSYDLDLAAGATAEADDLLLALARELVQNVVKHAGATSMEVKVRDEESALILEVADDGRGMPPGRPSEALRQGHIGLASARERVDALGGQLELISEPGSGTHVKVTVPRDGLAGFASGAG